MENARDAGEVERLIEAAKQNRSGHRDATAMAAWSRHHGSGSSAYFWQSGLIAASQVHEETAGVLIVRDPREELNLIKGRT
jgi:hypothetical protein